MDLASGGLVPPPARTAAGIPTGGPPALTRPGLPRGANRAAPLRPGRPDAGDGSRSPEALYAHHACPNGVPNELGNVMRAEFPHDAAAMKVHGLHRDF